MHFLLLRLLLIERVLKLGLWLLWSVVRCMRQRPWRVPGRAAERKRFMKCTVISGNRAAIITASAIASIVGTTGIRAYTGIIGFRWNGRKGSRLWQ